MSEVEVFDTLKYHIEVDKLGTRYYRNSAGLLHRLDGPAIEYPDGSKSWCQNGKLHRIDGPAVEWASGRKEWWQNGLRHRTDGPAIVYSDGAKEWYINGEVLTEAGFNQRVKLL